jgi:hemoglobin
MYSEITEENIPLLVDGFYDKVRAEPHLGKVFTEAIGDTDEEWAPHLQQMYRFWSSMMLRTGTFDGSPMKKHKELPTFPQNLFQDWLRLFEERARELYISDIAEQFIQRSHMIAFSLQSVLYKKAV